MSLKRAKCYLNGFKIAIFFRKLQKNLPYETPFAIRLRIELQHFAHCRSVEYIFECRKYF